MLTTLNSIHPVTLRDQVLEEIQRAILEGQIKPGDRIREHDLTQALNVSRTPVREALALLEREGLVVNLRNRGCFVGTFDEHDIREIFTMRAGLENLAARLLVNQLKDEHFQHLANLIEEQVSVYNSAVSDKPRRAGMIDLEFHRYLIQLTGNNRLLSTWRVIAMQCTVVFSYTIDNPILGLQTHRQLAIDSHRTLLAALRARELAKVEETNWRVNNKMAEHCIAAYRQLHQPV